MAETGTEIEPKLTDYNIFDEDAPRPAKGADEAPKQEIGKTDPVIEEKDKNIEKEKPIVDKPNEPEAIPKATPKDIPAREDEESKETTSEVDTAQWLKDNEDKLYEILSQKQTLKNLDKLSSEEVIKVLLKNENKDYTPQEIDDLFAETFIAPEKPEREFDETDDEFKLRNDKYSEKLDRYNRKLEREARTSKNELLKLSQELEYPQIPKQKQQPQQNAQSQEELEATQKARENYLSSIDEGLGKFNSIDATFKDKDVEIKAAYKISAEEKKELKKEMEGFNLEQFIQERWLTKDGKFNTAQQAEDIFLLTKGKEATAKLIEQTVSKRMESFIKSQKNVDVSGQSRSGNFQPSLEQQEEEAAKFFFSN